MIFTAFKHYLRRHLAKSYSLRNLVVFTVAYLWLTAALVPASLVYFDTHVTGRDLGLIYLSCFVLFPLMVLLRNVIQALIYGMSFSGYEIIHHYYGYRGIRHRFVNQKYNKEYFELFSNQDGERIVASTIRARNDVMWTVMAPGRHHHCREFMYQNNAIDHEGEEGFMTDKLRFVDREEARTLALSTGQVKTTARPTELFSEDLWNTPAHLIHQG